MFYILRQPNHAQQPPDVLRLMAGAMLMEQHRHYTGFLIELNEDDQTDTAGEHHAVCQLEAIRIARRMIANTQSPN